MSETLNLSSVHPDQADIKSQLEAYLSTQESWKGALESQTGQGIISLLASIGAFSQLKIQRKFEDSFPETVVSDSAAYALSTYQGVRLTRKLPAAVQVNIQSIGLAQTIPAYTVFQGAGGFFFNRDAVFLDANVTIPLELYEGDVKRFSMPGLDQPYAMFVSAETAFTVSDVDVGIQINNAPMARVTGGMWTLEGQLGFVDSTLPEGKLLVQFGNQEFGGQPTANDTLYLTYVTTNGGDANSLDTNGKGFTCPAYDTITGRFTSNPTGGANERPALSYKNIAAPTFGVFNSAITKQQYITTALEYPGVIDVIPFAQREVNPSALEWMNLIKLVMLTSSTWTNAQNQDFIQYMQNNSAFSPRFILDYPVPEPVSIVMDIYCYNWNNSTQAKLKAIAAIQNLFVPRIGILNYDLHLSDIIEAAQDADPGIEYVVLKSPANDVLISGKALAPPVLTLMTGQGNLLVDTYYYGIQATTSQGIIAVHLLSQLATTQLGCSISLAWESVTDAVSYQLYRKDTISQRPLLLADVPANTLTFIDNGTLTLGGSPSPQNTIPVRYIQLSDITVIDHYSTRGTRN